MKSKIGSKNPYVIAYKWAREQEEISNFLSQVPEDRKLTIKFNELVGKYEDTIDRVSRFLPFCSKFSSFDNSTNPTEDQIASMSENWENIAYLPSMKVPQNNDSESYGAIEHNVDRQLCRLGYTKRGSQKKLERSFGTRRNDLIDDYELIKRVVLMQKHKPHLEQQKTYYSYLCDFCPNLFFHKDPPTGIPLRYLAD
jgi:hypothetical protein